MASTTESIYSLEPLSAAAYNGQTQNRSGREHYSLRMSHARQRNLPLLAAFILSVGIHILWLAWMRTPYVEQGSDGTRAYGLAVHFASVAAITFEDVTKGEAQVSKSKVTQVSLGTTHAPVHSKWEIDELQVKHTLPNRETAITPIKHSREKLVVNPKRSVKVNAERPQEAHATGLKSVNSDPGRHNTVDKTKQVESRHGTARRVLAGTDSAERERIDNAVASEDLSDSDNTPLILEPRYQGRPKPPRYPEQSIRRNQQGTVMVRANVSAQGEVTKAWVFHSSGYRLLDAAALSAVKQWTFMPTVRVGLAIESRVQVPVNFNLKQ